MPRPRGRRLATIKKATMDELAALESVKQVAEARRSLADLKRRVRDSQGDSRENLRERLRERLRGRRQSRDGDSPVGSLHCRAQQAGRADDYRAFPGTGFGILKPGT